MTFTDEMALAALRDKLKTLTPEERQLLREALNADAPASEGAAHAVAPIAAEHVDTALTRLGLNGHRDRRRVVITGLGAVTPIGNDVTTTWRHFVAGESGIDWVTSFDASPYPTRIAGEVKGWDPGLYMDAKEAKRMARCSQFALGAAHQALQDAGLPTDQPLGETAGVILGTGVGGFEIYQEALEDSFQRGQYRVRPTLAVAGLPNIPAFHVSLQFGAMGPLNTLVTACAAGTQAIGEGVELIRRGQAERVLAGGVEAMIGHMFFTGFTAIKAVSTSNDPPQKACRPFDARRDGFIISEGAAVLMLESLESALARGARIYAEVLGQSASADAYHVAAPEPDGQGAQRAMRWALADAHIQPQQVDYINTHGTSTPLNDKTETFAIKKVFAEHAYSLAINSSKSMIGHAFGGAGAIEALVATLTVQNDIIHPTINYEYPDPDCDLDYVPSVARRRPVNIALSNSFGLGGQNACLVIGKYRPTEALSNGATQPAVDA